MKLSTPAREIVTLIRRHHLNYDTFRAASHQARRHLNLKPPRRGKTVPKIIPDLDFQKFFAAISAGENLKHEIMMRLLFYSAVRIAEFCSIEISDVDLPAGKIYISQGKGDKDRYILFPDFFRSILRAYLSTIPHNTHLFESRQRRKYSERRIAQLIDHYTELSGINHNLHPHLFRHQALTWLTRQGLTDAQIQLISGHSSKKSLEIYQHVGLTDVKEDYNTAMRKLEI